MEEITQQDLKNTSVAIRIICRTLGREVSPLIFEYSDELIGLHFNALANAHAIYEREEDNIIFMDSLITNEHYMNLNQRYAERIFDLWQKAKKEVKNDDNERINNYI